MDGKAKPSSGLTLSTDKKQAQDLGGAVLFAEAKMGEFLKNIEREQGKRTDKLGSTNGTKLQSTGITKTEYAGNVPRNSGQGKGSRNERTNNENAD